MLQSIRAMPEFYHLPIVMVTSHSEKILSGSFSPTE